MALFLLAAQEKPQLTEHTVSKRSTPPWPNHKVLHYTSCHHLGLISVPVPNPIKQVWPRGSPLPTSRSHAATPSAAPSQHGEQCKQPECCARPWSCSTPVHKSFSSLNIPMENKHDDEENRATGILKTYMPVTRVLARY